MITQSALLLTHCYYNSIVICYIFKTVFPELVVEPGETPSNGTVW